MVTETGWFLTNPRLGAPGVMELHDFPYAETGLFLVVRAMSFFTSNPFLIANLFFLGTFPLVCWSALFVLRRFGVSDLVGLVASVLFAFAPYHLWRGMAHPHLSAYVAVPLTLMLALWLWRGVPLVFRARSASNPTEPASRRPVVTLLASLVISLSGPYYALFGLMIVAIAGMIGFLRMPRRDRALDAALVTGFIGVAFALQTLPFVLYQQTHPFNAKALFRPGVGVLLTGLRIDTMLVPVPGHRVFPTYDPLLRAMSDGSVIERDPARDGRSLQRLDSHALGTLGAAGLVVLLVAGLGCPVPALRAVPTMRELGQLTLAVLLLGMNGGFGELLSYSWLTKLRNFNRLEIYIEFLALFALARLADRWWARSSRPMRLVLPWILVAVLVLGLLDQIPPLIAPDPVRRTKAFASDSAFVARIEKTLPAGSMVMQLPPNSFPEFGTHMAMPDYNLFRGYFHSHNLHWSYGAIRGRENEAWHSSLAKLAPAELVRALRARGFAGIYINRLGHAGNASSLEFALSRELEQEPLISDDLELSFFRL
jgi:phosphoglycerol transferase